MDLGRFSVSLAVKNIETSQAFYEKLGFEAVDGNVQEKWLILKNGDAIIGLFEGMFEQNILTFNPSDVKALEAAFKEQGLELLQGSEDSMEGFVHITLADPDGNQILLDQI